MKLLAVGSILAACGLAAAAPSYHHQHHHHVAEGHDIGYAFATKHETLPNHQKRNHGVLMQAGMMVLMQLIIMLRIGINMLMINMTNMNSNMVSRI